MASYASVTKGKTPRIPETDIDEEMVEETPTPKTKKDKNAKKRSREENPETHEKKKKRKSVSNTPTVEPNETPTPDDVPDAEDFIPLQLPTGESDSDGELPFEETFTSNLSISKTNVGSYALENREARMRQNRVDAVVFKKDQWPSTCFYDREDDIFTDDAAKGPGMAFFREHPGLVLLVACNHSSAPGLHKIRVGAINSVLAAKGLPPAKASHELGNPGTWSAIALDSDETRSTLETEQVFGNRFYRLLFIVRPVPRRPYRTKVLQLLGGIPQKAEPLVQEHFLALEGVSSVESLKRDSDADGTTMSDLFVTIKLEKNKKLQLDSHVQLDTGIGGEINDITDQPHN